MSVTVYTEIIDNKIPLLLSKDAMKRADTVLYFSTDSVSMFGMKFQLDFTSSGGHYMIIIHPTLSRIPHNNPLLLNFSDMDQHGSTKVQSSRQTPQTIRAC